MSLTIQQLNALDVLQAGDQLPVASLANGDTRRASLTALATYMQSVLTPVGSFQTQYASPSASGFIVAITGSSGLNKWLILSPTGAFGSGSVTLPTVSTVVDGQEFQLNTTQLVTAFSVSGNGAGVVGSPTGLAANSFFRLKFDAVTSNWYRVG